jgi:hypothetical protein
MLKVSYANAVGYLMYAMVCIRPDLAHAVSVNHFRLSTSQCPKIVEETKDMLKVPYASAMGYLMYAMVCIRPDLAHEVSVVSKYMANLGKQHWDAVK